MADLRDKMLPDLSDEPSSDSEPQDLDSDDVSKTQGDLDNDGDHDMDDHDMEKKDKEESFGNSVAGDEGPETKDADYMNNKLAGGMNRPKGQHKHSYQAGDNPMAMTDSDLRASIRAELLQRLAEAKGAK
jgi:hypothetical protein